MSADGEQRAAEPLQKGGGHLLTHSSSQLVFSKEIPCTRHHTHGDGTTRAVRAHQSREVPWALRQRRGVLGGQAWLKDLSVPRQTIWPRLWYGYEREGLVAGEHFLTKTRRVFSCLWFYKKLLIEVNYNNPKRAETLSTQLDEFSESQLTAVTRAQVSKQNITNRPAWPFTTTRVPVILPFCQILTSWCSFWISVSELYI